MLERRALAALAAVGMAAAIVVACSKDETTATPAADAGGDSDSSRSSDGAPQADDGASLPDSGDAATPPVDAAIVDGPGEAGAECSFNRECNAALRCECDEATGCACQAGTRGTGKNGIDGCDSGNACASAVCVEGPADSGYFCSDECATSNDCKGKLPSCASIAFVGRICVRQN